MDPLLELCRARGIHVVEDACQAHGARYRGRPVGSLGDAGCFSFYPTKNLGAWGDGGALVTSNPTSPPECGCCVPTARRSATTTASRGHRSPARAPGSDPPGEARPPGGVEPEPPRRGGRPGHRVGAQRLAPTVATEHCGRPRLPPLRRANRDPRRAPRPSPRPRGRQRDPLSDPNPPPARLRQLGLGRGSLPNAETLADESCSLPIFPAIEEWQIAEIAEAVESFGDALDS